MTILRNPEQIVGYTEEAKETINNLGKKKPKEGYCEECGKKIEKDYLPSHFCEGCVKNYMSNTKK